MSWMSLADDNNTAVVLPDIDIKSYLVVSHNKTTAMTYTAALISSERVQLILCNQSNATSCGVIKSISFPSVLSNISKITAGLFVNNLGAAGWLYIATNTGLHGLDLSTFITLPYINQINVSVSSLAWNSKHQTIFIGTETKPWIYSYGATDEEWRFEHIIGLIDAPITSLVYNDVQDKLWIGQETGIILLSPVTLSTGYVHRFFSR
jgi:ligand-binding sensor domain-containing protein